MTGLKRVAHTLDSAGVFRCCLESWNQSGGELDNVDVIECKYAPAGDPAHGVVKGPGNKWRGRGLDRKPDE